MQDVLLDRDADLGRPAQGNHFVQAGILPAIHLADGHAVQGGDQRIALEFAARSGVPVDIVRGRQERLNRLGSVPVLGQQPVIGIPGLGNDLLERFNQVVVFGWNNDQFEASRGRYGFSHLDGIMPDEIPLMSLANIVHVDFQAPAHIGWPGRGAPGG